jgi:hypothetical protein
VLRATALVGGVLHVVLHRGHARRHRRTPRDERRDHHDRSRHPDEA